MKTFFSYRTNGAFPKKNILTSLLWLNAITFPPGSLALMFAPPIQGGMLFFVAILVLFITIYFYFYWTKNDPDRLQTEDYVLQKEYVSKFPVSVEYSADQIPPIDAPKVKRIGNMGGNHE